MPNNPAFDQIELVQSSVTTGSVSGYLAISFHGTQATAHGFDLLLINQFESSADLFVGQRTDTFAEIVQNKFPAWNRTLVFSGFTSRVGVNTFTFSRHKAKGYFLSELILVLFISFSIRHAVYVL